MSFLSNALINSAIVWTQKDESQGDISILDQSSVNQQVLFGSGTSTGKIGKVFYSGGSIPSAAPFSINFDLFNLQRNIFGSNQTINFSGGKVKIFYVEHMGISGILTGALLIGLTGFKSNLSGGDTINLMPSGNYLSSNVFGWDIETGNRHFTISSNTGDIPFEMAILGN